VSLLRSLGEGALILYPGFAPGALIPASFGGTLCADPQSRNSGKRDMQLIRCTAKLRKEMGLRDSDLFKGSVADSALGPWHANLIYINRRKCVLFVNDRTFFNFIVVDVRRSEIRKLHQLFLSYLYPVLAEEGFANCEREQIASEYKEVRYVKSTNRSVLGSMNDLTIHYKYRIMMEANIAGMDNTDITYMINRIPMGALKYAYPIEELRKVVRG